MSPDPRKAMYKDLIIVTGTAAAVIGGAGAAAEPANYGASGVTIAICGVLTALFTGLVKVREADINRVRDQFNNRIDELNKANENRWKAHTDLLVDISADLKSELKTIAVTLKEQGEHLAKCPLTTSAPLNPAPSAAPTPTRPGTT